MAEPKDTPKKDAEKADAKKPAAKKPAAKPASGKAKAKKEAAPTKPAAKKPAAKKAASTAAKSEGAAEATSTSKAADKTTADAKKPAAKKDAAKSGGKAAAAKSTPKPKAAASKEPAERPVVKARASYVRISPRKVRLIADQIRGMPLEDALTTLRFSPRGAAQDIAKLINSAAANAENNHDLVAEDLRISDITVNEGPTLRRYRPRAMGRATRINKRTSHINVALTPED